MERVHRLMFAVGFKVLAEALALGVGVYGFCRYGFCRSPNPWLHSRNVTLLCLDIFVGAGLTILVFLLGSLLLILASPVLGGLSHGCRVTELFLALAEPFTASVALVNVNVIVNALKPLGIRILVLLSQHCNVGRGFLDLG